MTAFGPIADCQPALSLLSSGSMNRATSAARVHDVAQRAAVDRAFAVVGVDPAEEVVGQVDVAAAYRFSYPFLNTLSGILNCPPVAANLSAKICRTLGSSSG